MSNPNPTPVDPNPVDPTPPNPPAGDPPAGDPPAGDPPAGDPPAGDPPAGDPPAGDPPAGDPPKEFTDEDFTKAMTASDEVKKAAGDDTLELSPELVKDMLPMIRKCGISPDQAKELANELAMKQIAAAKAAAQTRADDIKKMNDEAYKIYPDKQSWEAIGAGIERFFKPGGTMHETIVRSELGSDPEFLALMKWVGERCLKDNLASAPGSGGEKRVSYEKALGLG